MAAIEKKAIVFKNMKFALQISVLLCILWPQGALLGAGGVLSLENSVGEESYFDISPHLSFYEDKSAKATFEEILKKDGEFVPNQMARPIFGFTFSAIWGKFTIDPSEVISKKTGASQKWYLHFDYAMVRELDFYIPQPDGTYKKIETGMIHPGRLQNFIVPRPVLTLVFEHNPRSSLHTVYVRARSLNYIIEIPLSLMSGEEFVEHSGAIMLFHGIYYGLMLVMFLYNFFIYLTVRERSYLYYCFYTLSMVMVSFTIHGRSIVLLQDHFFLVQALNTIFAAASAILANLFAKEFLQTKRHWPVVNFLLNGFILCYAVFIVADLFIDFYPMLVYFTFLLVNSVVGIIAGLRFYRKHTYARYYTHAWFFFLVLLSIFSLRSLNVITSFSNYAIEVGGMIEVVLLSFALAGRIRHLQEEKRKYDIVQRDLKMATEVQKYLFPQSLPAEPGYSVAAKYLPSAALSGDFYDYYIDPKKNFHLLVVDVCGHGYAAGLVASMIKIAFHETFSDTKDFGLHQVEVNRVLCQNVQYVFATAVHLCIKPEEKKVSLVRSGHPPLLHYKKKEQSIEEYFPRGGPLGISRSFEPEVMTIAYEPGDRLVVYTDGLIEELNHVNEEYGVMRLKTRIQQSVSLDADQFAENLISEITTWIKGCEQKDDVTFVVIDLH